MADYATGRITYANGAPAPGVHVRVFDSDLTGTDDDLTLQEGISDSSGRFSVTYDRARAADTLTINLGLPQFGFRHTIRDPLDLYLPYFQLRYSLYGQERIEKVRLEEPDQDVRLPDPPPTSARFMPSQHGFRFLNSFAGTPLPFTIPALPGLSQIPASYGLCGGMSAAAADFLYAGRPIPETRSIPAKRTALYSYLLRRQIDSFSPLGEPVLRFMRWMKMDEATPLGTWHRSADECARLKALLDGGLPVHPIGLVFANPGEPLWENHQVLAYGYRETSLSQIEIPIYDPNYPENDQVYIRAERMQLSGANTSGETVSVVSMRCRRVAIVADALGRATEDVRTMRGLFLMPYEPVEPPQGL